MKIGIVWTRLCKAWDCLGRIIRERLFEVLYTRIFEQSGRSREPKDWPQLHSKGAVARHIVPALKGMMMELLDWAPEYANTAGLTCLWACVCIVGNLTQFYDCMFANDLILPDESASELYQCILEVGAQHQELLTHFMGAGRALFHITEKANFVQHLGLDCISRKLNPRFGWTYADEDFMGRIAGMAKASTRGRGPIRLGTAIVERWRTRMSIAWTRRLDNE